MNALHSLGSLICLFYLRYIAYQAKDTGYPHDGSADNAAYPHNRHADNAAYPHNMPNVLQFWFSFVLNILMQI